ncbi:hydratase [Bordetella avium]|uniref:hydratase n=1 Tax=Bordetella avium TaxID=521 RepID=UPI000E0B3597|nr:hydratase [Bordetella avium]AZY49220.1 hydratase [Bordetella avium]RIQ12700.1 hydratase [Bordetella avium]RIQ19262.1 hydratase [Bordetella avium]RIQ33430.1 hydratase [Bordetella avium]RIQ37872.1 hydratase [Bordetella avium]
MSEPIQFYAGAPAAARILRKARHAPGERLPETCRPATQGQALAVQQAQSALRLVEGDPIAAWKCGLPLPDKLRLAPIYVSGLQRAGPLSLGRGQVRIEPEIAFELRHDLPPRAKPYAQAEIEASIGGARLALEVIGSRYREPQHLPHIELLADHLNNDGLVLGPAITQAAPATMPLTLHIEGQAERLIDGRHPDGEPLAGLYWLVNYLRENGKGLVAGQHIITGSYAGVIDVPARGRVSLRYGDLGTLELELHERA